MGHYNAMYVVPGLMPPNDTNNQMRVILPEDGSMFACVHCGPVTDEVHYAIDVWGPCLRSGVVKDPSYDFGAAVFCRWFMKNKDKWPQFMIKSDVLPEGCRVLNKVVRGDWTVPVTEKPCMEDGDKRYWILELPPGSIPYGQSVLELVINGRKVEHVLNRPQFSIHNRGRNAQRRMWPYSHQKGETLDFMFDAAKGGDMAVGLRFKGRACMLPVPDEAEFRANMGYGDKKVQLDCAVGDDGMLHIAVPPSDPVRSIWRAEFNVFGEWHTLACGDVTLVHVEEEADDGSMS